MAEGDTRDAKLRIDAQVKKRVQDPSGFYAALGVASTADSATIRKAFLHQSTLYHTDRHAGITEDQKQLLNERFQKLNDAYQTLSDPRRRAAYDAAGDVGGDRLELIPGNITERSEIIRALDALEREAEARRVAKMVGSASGIELSLNILSLATGNGNQQQHAPVAPTPAPPPAQPKKEEQPSHDEKPKSAHLNLSNAQMSFSVAEINGQKKLVLVPADGVLEQALPPEAQAQLKQLLGSDTPSKPKGRGWLSAVDSIKVHHQFQHAIGNNFAFLVRAEGKQEANKYSTGVLIRTQYVLSTVTSIATAIKLSWSKIRVGVNLTKVLSPVVSLTTKLGLYDGQSFLPVLGLSMQRALSETVSLTNALKWTLKEKGGSFSCTLAQQQDASSGRGLIVRIEKGSLQLSLYKAAALAWRLGDWEAAGSSSTSVSMDCIKGTTTANYQAWYELDNFYSVGFGVMHQLPLALSPLAPPFFLIASQRFAGFTQYSVLYKRGEQTISIPIVVSLTPNIFAAALMAAAPFALVRGVLRVMKPLLLVRLARRVAAQRAEFKDEVEAAKQKAMAEQEAIRNEVVSRQEREGHQGLIIQNAKFGILNPEVPQLEGAVAPEVVDVTLAVQSYVRDSVLELPEGEMTELVGFYDPDPSGAEKKVLKVSYWWRQQKHECEVENGSAVRLPDDAHRVLA